MRFISIGQFSVSFAGHALTPVPLASGPGLAESYGCDISPYAGQYGQLTFSAPDTLVGQNILDDIMFSTQPIPEPGLAALLAVGAALFGLMRRKLTRP